MVTPENAVKNIKDFHEILLSSIPSTSSNDSSCHFWTGSYRIYENAIVAVLISWNQITMNELIGD